MRGEVVDKEYAKMQINHIKELLGLLEIRLNENNEYIFDNVQHTMRTIESEMDTLRDRYTFYIEYGEDDD